MAKSQQQSEKNRALHKHGKIAIIDTHHVDHGIDRFPEESQECYRKLDPETPADITYQVQRK